MARGIIQEGVVIRNPILDARRVIGSLSTRVSGMVFVYVRGLVGPIFVSGGRVPSSPSSVCAAHRGIVGL